MKRLLIMAVLIFLVACGNDLTVHENVDKDLATDTMQVIDIMVELSESQKDPNEKQQTTFDEYIKKYDYQEEQGNLKDINEDIYLFTKTTIQTLDRHTSLESGKSYIADLKTTITNYIENGDTGTGTYKASE